MKRATTYSVVRTLFLVTSVFAGIAGCGGASVSTAPAPLKDRDEIIKALPPGITLDTPIVPDRLYGESSKTVEDALASLQAYVKNGVIQDGGMNQEIQFDSGAAVKSSKVAKRAGKPTLKIRLAK